VKTTEPVGGTDVVFAKVAVSDTGSIGTVAVPLSGAACVVIVGDAEFTVSCSLLSPHDVVKPLLLASPA
jgi:hypothetical protein